MTRLLGIDLGDRRIGLAVGDPVSGTIRPLATVGRRDVDGDLATLGAVVTEQGITELVIGLPLHADGREGEQAARTRNWAHAVSPVLGLPVTWRDERRTSMDAEARIGGPRRGRSGGAPSSAARRAWRGRIDQDAAVSIVQRELDARRSAVAVGVTSPAGALGTPSTSADPRTPEAVR